jgi:uncharacterized damage-inducible protein DinB
MKTIRTGAIGAMLDEYELAIAQLQKVIHFITEEQLLATTDPHTEDINCRSVQTILAHVVKAGYNYATQIANHKGASLPRPEIILRGSISEYLEDLNDMFAFTEHVFQDIREDEVLEYDNSRKILVSWGQSYDIEQLMEHAIVHILRHRRQIEQIQRNDFKYVA